MGARRPQQKNCNRIVCSAKWMQIKSRAKRFSLRRPRNEENERDANKELNEITLFSMQFMNNKYNQQKTET